MKYFKYFLTSLIILHLCVLSCGCDTKEDIKYAASEIQNKITETEATKFSEEQVKAMAKNIFDSFATYLTKCGIKEIPVSADTTYDDIVDILVSDYGLRLEYKYYDIDVSWKFSNETYSVQEVTVTVDGITETY